MSEARDLPRWRRGARLVLLRGPFWEASRGRRTLRLFVFGAYLYLGTLLVLMALENSLLYVAARADCPYRDAPPGAGVEVVTLRADDGNTIVAWWLTPPGWRPAQGAVHYSHGNGCNISHLLDEAAPLRDELGRAVLMYDYPGYGRSTGRPTETGCYHAGEAAHRWLVEVKGVPPDEIILLGRSLGAGIATELATRHEHRLLLLLAPFTSFPDIAQTRVPWFPVRWLARNKFDNLAKVARARGPVMIVHGDRDELIPLAMGRRVFDAAPEPKRWLALPRLGHNYLPPREMYAAVRQFLAKLK